MVWPASGGRRRIKLKSVKRHNKYSQLRKMFGHSHLTLKGDNRKLWGSDVFVQITSMFVCVCVLTHSISQQFLLLPCCQKITVSLFLECAWVHWGMVLLTSSDVWILMQTFLKGGTSYLDVHEMVSGCFPLLSFSTWHTNPFLGLFVSVVPKGLLFVTKRFTKQWNWITSYTISISMTMEQL